MNLKSFHLGWFLLLFLVLPACDKNNDFVIFSIQEDKKLGEKVAAQIESEPDKFPILDPVAHKEAYDYLENIKNSILQSDDVSYKEEFAWEIKIIDQDVLNAFATPGGYLYVYSGLIKYLDKEDDLAGVIGHEIAHSDQRHSSKQLQKTYGIQVLLSVLVGENADVLEQIVSGLTSLKFSRDAEYEADSFSVKYLADTKYQCNGAASFFEKLLANNQTSGVPEFLSTHPSPENRVAEMNAQATELGCETTPYNPTSYQTFKNMLP
ncbi:MAG: M48 family metallopeptidase [Candidatus Cyclobacteriaceae bacterium M3_2C_046]